MIGSIETIHGAAELIDELAPRLGAVSAADVVDGGCRPGRATPGHPRAAAGSALKTREVITEMSTTTTPPPIGRLRATKVPPLLESELPGGLHSVFVRHRALPLVELRLVVPLAAAEIQKPALTSVLSEAMFAGTEPRPSRAGRRPSRASAAVSWLTRRGPTGDRRVRAG